MLVNYCEEDAWERCLAYHDDTKSMVRTWYKAAHTLSNLPQSLNVHVWRLPHVHVCRITREMHLPTHNIVHTVLCWRCVWWAKLLPTKPTHSMLVIGYGTYKGEQFWLVKNRWGDLNTAQVCTGSFAVQISLKTILSFWVMLRQLFAWGRGWVIAAQASSLS